MLKCSTSLWSADLANLGAEIRRVEPYSEAFHIDVADGHYVPNLLFFPDLVKALRKHTGRPFEVHLMTTDPLEWVEPFAEAGAERVIFCLDSVGDPAGAIEAAGPHVKSVGFSLLVSEPVTLLEDFWDRIDLVTIVGTPMGIKGASMDPSIPDKVRQARATIRELGLKTEVEVDGGIRRNTVPLLKEAGADWIVPGSLMFGEDPRSMRQWLDGL
jgi:ribulose-phosphate 3-epimerase